MPGNLFLFAENLGLAASQRLGKRGGSVTVPKRQPASGGSTDGVRLSQGQYLAAKPRA